MTEAEVSKGGEELAKLVTGRKRRRLWPWLVLVMALGGGAGAWALVVRPGQSGSALRYTTEAASRGNLLVTVTATGTVEPTTQVTISSELSGTMATVEVDYNDRVEPGQTLATLDDVKRRAQVTNAEASLKVAQGQLEQARATAIEAEAIFLQQTAINERGIGAARDLITYQAAHERAQAALTVAEANLQLGQANLDSARDDLDKMVLRSPIKGVVLDRAAETGQIVASSLNAPTLFTLAEDLARMKLLVDVDEADIGKVAVGNQATFTVDAFPGRVFPAEITQVRLAPVVTNNVVTYKAQLSVDNADLSLRPGMTATAVIEVTRVEDALVVPNAALRYAPPQTAGQAPGQARGTQQTQTRGLAGLIMPARRPSDAARPQGAAARGQVYVLKDGQPVAVRARTGESDGRVTVITDGDLAEGDLVITGQYTGGTAQAAAAGAGPRPGQPPGQAPGQALGQAPGQAMAQTADRPAGQGSRQ